MTSLHKWLKPKRLAIFEACLIGLVAGLAAVILKWGIGLVGGWRVNLANDMPAWFVLPVIGLIGGFLSGFLIERFAPEASGSGIPQVKAALGYVPIALNLRVAVVKLASSMLSLGSGLALGRQGPTVQISAALAAQISQWIPTSPENQRQLIAAGAAAGLSAGFNAPIAGVLFVVEELLQDVSSLTLGTAIIASFTGGMIARLLGGQIPHPIIPNVQFSVQEIPFLISLGFLVGCFAALFNHSVIAATQWNRRFFKMGLSWRIAIAGCLTGLVIAMLPKDFRDSTGLQLYLALGQSDWEVTAATFVVRFLLTLIACSAETPGGLFVPSLILGASLGSLVGNIEYSLLGTGNLTIYALSGMGAFFGAVAKTPITAFVMVFEISMDFTIVLPLMITSVVAYLCAEKYAPISLYNRLLEMRGIHLETKTMTEGLWNGLRAVDVMQRQVETLSSQMTVKEAMLSFARSRHRGFPVVTDTNLVGIITQIDLDKVHEQNLSGDIKIDQIMTPNPITASPEESLSQILYLLSYYKLSRLPVIDRNKLVGIITRSDILRAQTRRLSRGSSPQTNNLSYLVYQTRGPSIGKGRILLPLSNPKTADYLIEIALAIAKERNYELECLHIISIAPHLSPSETYVDLNPILKVFQQASIAAELHQVPIHTQVRVSHNVSQAILEIAGYRQIDLLLIGWNGHSSSSEQKFGNTVSNLLKQINCDVMLIKFSDRLQKFNQFTQEFKKRSISFNRWLILINEAVNTENALQLLPPLMPLSSYPEVCLCQIFSPVNKKHEDSQLEKYADSLDKSLGFSVSTVPIYSESIADAIIDLADEQRSDVIMLGASHESFLQQMLHGDISEQIARNSDRTIIIFRKSPVG